MADTPPRSGSASDTSEYAPTKAPDTERHATEEETQSDHRLIPGGKHGARAEVGMSAMDRESVPSRAEKPVQREEGS